jgi:hypothetical protein
LAQFAAISSIKRYSGIALIWKESSRIVCLRQHCVKPVSPENRSQLILLHISWNPVRAGLAESPEKSDYTSVQERTDNRPTPTQETRLVPLTDNERQHADTDGIHFRTDDYLDLVD